MKDRAKTKDPTDGPGGPFNEEQMHWWRSVRELLHRFEATAEVQQATVHELREALRYQELRTMVLMLILRRKDIISDELVSLLTPGAHDRIEALAAGKSVDEALADYEAEL